MAYVNPWDEPLEALTAELVAMADGRGKPCGFRTDNGWLCAMSAVKQKVTVELSAPDPANPGLDDYELVLIYNLSFQVPRPWPEQPTFRKVLTLHEDYRWEEQMLREIALESLGVARHVLHAGDVTVLQPGELTFTRTRKGPMRRR